MGVGPGHRGMRHPDLLAGPARALRSRPRRLPEQGPLQAVGLSIGVVEIGGDIPPIDAEVRKRTVIPGKAEQLAGRYLRKAVAVFAEAREALRARPGVEPGEHEAGRKGTA